MSNPATNVLIVDFGTTYNKITAYTDSAFLNRQMIVNRIYEITDANVKAVARFDGATIPTGLFTERDLVDAGLTAHANEVPVQLGAATFDEHRLKVAYRNTFEKMEDTLKVAILNRPADWYLMSAVALPETEETQKKLAAIHEKVLKTFGFSGIYVRNQVSLAILGNIKKLSEHMTSPFTAQVMDMGGGDTKTVTVSKEPVPSTIRREPIGGIDVLEHARQIVKEQINDEVRSTSEIQQWLINWGNADGRAQDHEVNYRGHNLQIRDLLDAPRMLFEPELFKGTVNKRSISKVLVESLKAARLQGKELLFDHIIGCILVTGGGSQWGGVLDRLKREVSEAFPDYAEKITLVHADEPQWSTLNGMMTLLATKVEKKEQIDWIV